MQEELLEYYRRELDYIRLMGKEYAEKYPKIASRLVLEADKCEDPHVERLLEGFAFLAARVHWKIDDDFPEITEALLNIVYPHYLRPIPSMSVVEFQLDPAQGKLTSGLKIPRGAILYSRPVGGVPCKFRTCYDTTLWPLEVSSAAWTTPDRIQPAISSGGALAVLRMEVRCLSEVSFDKLALGTLRFFLNGSNQLVDSLYELLLNNCTQILLRDPTNLKRPPIRLTGESLRAVGFAEEESLLPYPRRSFDGYRLLQEYFAFPEKFHFLDLTGLEAAGKAGFQESMEILIYLRPFEREDRWHMLESNTGTQTFRLGCSPVVNLFKQTAEPILLRHTEYEYPIVPDARRIRSIGVFSVDDVVSTSPESDEVRHYDQFYSFRHADERDRKQTFWYATRRPAAWRSEGGTDLYIALVDLTGRPCVPDTDAITARLTCTNRDLPSRLPFGNEAGDFELEGGTPVRRITALRKPTPGYLPPSGKAAFWRLISHLSLNHLSLVSDGKEALQEILRIYNFTDSVPVERQIQGIVQLSSRPHFTRVLSDQGVHFARGTLVEMEMDEEQFVGAGVYVFASVLERFLGMYTSLNSFSQLVVRTRQRKEVLKRWQPRAGRKILM